LCLNATTPPADCIRLTTWVMQGHPAQTPLMVFTHYWLTKYCSSNISSNHDLILILDFKWPAIHVRQSGTTKSSTMELYSNSHSYKTHLQLNLLFTKRRQRNIIHVQTSHFDKCSHGYEIQSLILTQVCNSRMCEIQVVRKRIMKEIFKTLYNEKRHGLSMSNIVSSVRFWIIWRADK